MLAIYGHTWSSQYGVQPSGLAADTWAGVLAGLSGKQLADGLHATVAEGREFPPSAPRFRAMCLGIPSLARVRLEVTGPDAERSRFSRAVWAFIDSYRWRNASNEQTEKLLKDAYDLAHDEVMRGVQLPTAPVAELFEEKRPIVVATPEQQARHLAKIRGLLEGNDTPDDDAGEGL